MVKIDWEVPDCPLSCEGIRGWNSIGLVGAGVGEEELQWDEWNNILVPVEGDLYFLGEVFIEWPGHRPGQKERYFALVTKHETLFVVAINMAVIGCVMMVFRVGLEDLPEEVRAVAEQLLQN